MTFDPEGHFSKNSSIFGLPKDMEAKLHILPSPWEPTTSFKKGCKNGPKSIYEASKQMDLYHPYFKKIYNKGIQWGSNTAAKISDLNVKASVLCDQIQKDLDNDKAPDQKIIARINDLSTEYNTCIYDESLDLLAQDKTVGLVGGDHSCPFGLIKALSEKHKGEFSIVHLDAHFDFRDSYQGFTHSHASIMYNIITKLKHPPKLYQIGLRDFCESEYNFALKNSKFILDQEFQKLKFLGHSFSEILDKFLEGLNEKVYISFDIDGLSPEFCPNTGTPVPGGLNYNEAQFIIEELHRRGHKLIGFDLVEVSPSGSLNAFGEGIDEVTAVRLLYALSCFALSS